MPNRHPIVVLWAHPRSMSTAFERIMRERGDCHCLHEPFLYDYYVERGVRDMPMLEAAPDEPRTYEAVRDKLLRLSQSGPVFVKDMSYYVVPRIFADTDFSDRLTNAFLIRDPRRSIPSYHKLDPAVTMEEIGLDAQWRHFRFLRERHGSAPPVIEAERVQADPKGMMRAFWRRAGLADKPEALDWQSEETPKDWQAVEGWHRKVLASSGIVPPRGDAEAAFERAARETPRLRALLARHAPFYEKLRAFSLEPCEAGRA